MGSSGGVAFVLVLLLTGCGGKSTDSDTPPESLGEGGTSAGRAGNGDAVAGSSSESGTTSAPGGGTSTSNGGGAPAEGDCDPNALDDSCVEGCGVDLFNPFPPICSAKQWQCAEGFVSLKTCPEQSCARTQRSCCEVELGRIQSAPCVDGVRLECPPGASELPEGYAACRPPGVSNCRDLSGSCSDDALECHSGERCGTSCNCDAGPDGSLVWVCLSLLC